MTKGVQQTGIHKMWQLDVPGSVIRQEHGSIMYDSTRKAFPQILVTAWFDTS
jgi:hypothetical protein